MKKNMKAPVATPSLADDAAEFEQLTAALWGSGDGEHSFGKGRVYSGKSIEAVLGAMGLSPDVSYEKTMPDTNLLHVHRKLDDGDLYFVDSRNDYSQSMEVSFRTSGKIPELWHADTGQIEAVSYHIADDRTTVLLDLDPWEAVFVVFRKPATKTSLSLAKPERSVLTNFEGPWNVAFQEGRGAPPEIEIEKLSSWSESNDAGVKYFSGTPVYSKTIKAPEVWFKNGHRLLYNADDPLLTSGLLGPVRIIQEIR